MKDEAMTDSVKHTCAQSGISNCTPCIRWRVEMWNRINAYVVACGGDPSKHVYGNTARMRAVADVERAVTLACNNDEVR